MGEAQVSSSTECDHSGNTQETAPTPVPIPGEIPHAQVQAEGRVCSLLTECLCGLVGFPS